ncbi:MAG TPA: hypothetical protein VFU69_18915 [Ktedonobacterales bacterium]|nr:hypothetical protein [Ktedonobacterales bacterium]
MAQSSRRSRRFQNKAGCSASSGRPRKGSVSHRRTAVRQPTPVELECGLLLVSIKLRLAQALRQFLQATDYLEACEVAVHNPILLLESAPELLRATVEEAERRGDEADKDMLLSYLKVLELARETNIGSIGNCD